MTRWLAACGPCADDAGQVLDRADQGAEQVDVVIGGRALQQRGDALEPHAGVDRGARQRRAFAWRDLLILHEDEVPEFEKSVAVLRPGCRAGRPPASRPDRRKSPSRGRRGRCRPCPEIVGAGDADDAVVGKAGDFLPQAEGFLVVVIDRDQQAVLRQAELAGDQRPGEFDRAFLEIIAEGKIAEHFEKGVVARGIADIVEVVVLAAGAHAFLRARRARV